jgi:hypothetical protein
MSNPAKHAFSVEMRDLDNDDYGGGGQKQSGKLCCQPKEIEYLRPKYIYHALHLMHMLRGGKDSQNNYCNGSQSEKQLCAVFKVMLHQLKQHF